MLWDRRRRRQEGDLSFVRVHKQGVALLLYLSLVKLQEDFDDLTYGCQGRGLSCCYYNGELCLCFLWWIACFLEGASWLGRYH